MTTKPHKSVLRLPKKHRGAADKVDKVNVAELLAQQSLRDAVVAGIIVIILFSILWAMLSTLVNRIFPWMTIILGVVIGVIAAYFPASRAAKLDVLEDDGLIELSETGIEITPRGRLLLRNIAMTFDRYMGTGENDNRFSRAI